MQSLSQHYFPLKQDVFEFKAFHSCLFFEYLEIQEEVEGVIVILLLSQHCFPLTQAVFQSQGLSFLLLIEILYNSRRILYHISRKSAE